MPTRPSHPPSTAELLAEHVGWIRELARRLCADANQADDLVQETCVVALESSPRDATKLRPWLAAVLRNAWRQSGRGEARRVSREHAAARSEITESTDRLVERIAVERELAAFVLELAEPYRTAILLRFFEGLAPREIARRLGVPVNTVHSRIARGLERLRARLDDEHDGRTWLAALLPLIEKPALLPTVALGGLLVNTKAALLVVSIAVAGVLAALAVLEGTGGTVPQDPAPAALAAVHAESPALESSPSVPGAARVAETTVVTSAAALDGASPVPDAAVLRVVRGRVLDADGVPTGGIELRLEEEPGTVVKSGAGGRFELRTMLASATFSAASEALTTVRSGTWRAETTYEPIVVIAPAIDLAGSVENAAGMPLSGALVSYVLPPGFDTRFDAILEASRIHGRAVRGDDRGRFRLPRVPWIAGASLRAVVDGYAPSTLALPDASDAGLVFVLERPAVPLAGALRGRVIDAEGRPVADARVAAGLTSTVTDEDGEFVIDLARAVTALSISAVKAGHRPARITWIAERRPGEPSWVDEIVLQLGPPPLSIAGRVVDHEARPKPGVRVWIGDPTPFGLIGIVPMQSEHLAAGASVPKQAVDSISRLRAQDGDDFLDFTLSPRPSDAFWYWVKTDGEGRFEIGGLDDRKYVLKVFDPKTLVTVSSEPVRAGDRAAELRLPAPKLLSKLAGRVLDDDGRPVAGVDVQLYVSPFGIRSRFFGGTVDIANWEPRELVRTGADGVFSFADVPADGPFVELVSDDIVPVTYRLEPDDDPAALEIRVRTRCHVEVRLKPPHARADAARFRDGEGKPLEVILLSNGGVNVYSSAELVEGRSGVVSVSSAARTLVLLRSGEVVEEHAIDLRSGEVNVLEP